MAEAFFNAIAYERGLDARAVSAGTAGAGALNPAVVVAMREIGMDMEGQYPKVISTEMVSGASRIVGMGCGVDADACPTNFLLAEDWGLDDPAGQSLDAVRVIRDEIRGRVSQMVGEMLAAGGVKAC